MNSQNKESNNNAESFENYLSDFENFDVTFKQDDSSNEDFTEVIIEGRNRKHHTEGEYLENVVLASGTQSLQSERFREKTRSTRAAQKALSELEEQSLQSMHQENKINSEPVSSDSTLKKQPLQAEESSAQEEKNSQKPQSAKPTKAVEPFQVDENDENSDKRRYHYHSKSHSKLGRRWRKLKGWQKGIIIFLLILLFLIAASVGTVYFMHTNGKKNTMAENYGENFENIIVYKDVEYLYNTDITSIAFIGVDRRKFGLQDDLVGTAGQGDVNMVIAIDTKTGESNVIMIPRDTWVDVNKYSLDGEYMGTQKQQLCLAYAYGDGGTTSCDNQIASLQRILYGIPINTYVALNLDGIKPLNEAVGGVTLTCPNNFGEYQKGEEITLHGDEAEKFIRSREHTNAGDSGRRERQIAYVKAYINQALEQALVNPASLTDIYNTGKDYTVTNLSLARSLYFSETIISNLSSAVSFDKVYSLKGTLKEDEGGYAKVVLNEDEALKTVLDVYYTALQ